MPYTDWAALMHCLSYLIHHLQKSLHAGTESYIVQLDFIATFDRVSHIGLVFKLKYICEGGSVLCICRELLSDRGQRVMVDRVYC